jgi:hypothetical protein
MSGYSTSATAPNTFFYTPDTGTYLYTPKTPTRITLSYTPVCTHNWAGTAFDIRAFYPADHPLRKLCKVLKPAPKERDPLSHTSPLWR